MITIAEAQENPGRLARYVLPDPAQPVRECYVLTPDGRYVWVQFKGAERPELTNPDYLYWDDPS